ncbi:MAG: hypothetical protein H7125_02020 [Proteobacteria bacterium]|nr:hypothetical protein [Burkholderiales bacterium]
MKRNLFIGALCATFALAAPAVHALTLTSVNLNGNDNNGVLILGNTLGVDAGMRNAGPAIFNFTIDPNSAVMYNFNSIVQNLSGANWGALTISLRGDAFFSPVPGTPSGFGSVTPGFGSISGVVVTPPVDPFSQMIRFGGSGEPFEVQAGNPFVSAGLFDWQLSLSRLDMGDTFSVVIETSPIPVPGGLVLLLSGLAGVATFARKKKVA